MTWDIWQESDIGNINMNSTTFQWTNNTINTSPSITTVWSTNTSPYTSVYGAPTITSPNVTNTTWTIPNTNLPVLDVKGDADFHADVRIKGKSLIDALEKIEEKLAILHPNEELEEKWEQLRGLRKMYMDLEAEIKEKEKVWGILKK